MRLARPTLKACRAACATPQQGPSLAVPTLWKGKAREINDRFHSTSTSFEPFANREIDPRGIDYSLFEHEYSGHVAVEPKQEGSLSQPVSLLLRLIKEKDFDKANVYLHELLGLNTPLPDALPEFSRAALWAMQTGRQWDAAMWMQLCPSLHNGVLRTASSTDVHQQERMISANFRRLLAMLVNLHGRDLELVQRTSLIAASKGYASLLQAPLAHVLRYGATQSDDSPKGWNFYLALFKAAGVGSGKKNLYALYNGGIRTLALAGNFADAVGWVESGRKHNLVPDKFTQRLLLEELHRAKRGDLARILSSAPQDDVVEPMELKAEQQSVDKQLREYLAADDVIGARHHLLAALELAEPAISTGSRNGRFVKLLHLPSAAALSRLQSMAMDAESATSPMDVEFLRPVRERLDSVRAGKGLWDTATLYGLVQKRKWEVAVRYYTQAFQLPSGGITVELVNLVLKGTRDGATYGRRWPSTNAINLVLKAIANLCVNSKDFAVLQEAYRLWRDASLPEARELPATTAETTQDLIDRVKQAQNERLPKLTFQSWTPSQRPSSHSFDSFLRAFARLHVVEQLVPRPEHSEHKPAPRKRTHRDWSSSKAVFEVMKDMTETFQIQPDISSWTIALECLGREGRERWTTTTEALARAVGVNTSSVELSDIVALPDNFPPATLTTYASLMQSLMRIPFDEPMLLEAGYVRDDLLLRISDLRPATHDEFWEATEARWRTLRESTFHTRDTRPQWTQEMLLSPKHTALDAMHEIWRAETAPQQHIDEEEASDAHL